METNMLALANKVAIVTGASSGSVAPPQNFSPKKERRSSSRRVGWRSSMR